MFKKVSRKKGMKGAGHDSTNEKNSKNQRKRKTKEISSMRQINAKTSSSILCFLLILSSSLFGLEKLPEKYTVSLGSIEAEHTVVEYFSLSCPLCLKLIKKDFKNIYTQFVETKQIYWTFHPDPADLSTLQLMVCLEKLPHSKKWAFFWEAIQTAAPNNPSRNTFLLQELSKQFALDIPLLHDIKWLESTKAFQEAFKYTKQMDAPTEIPSIEFDGTLREDLMPTTQVIEELVSDCKNLRSSLTHLYPDELHAHVQQLGASCCRVPHFAHQASLGANMTADFCNQTLACR